MEVKCQLSPNELPSNGSPIDIASQGRLFHNEEVPPRFAFSDTLNTIPSVC